MWVAALRLELLCRAQSLKDKRRAVVRVRDSVSQRYGVAIGEVESPDDKHRAVLGLSTVGSSSSELKSLLQEIEGFIRQRSEVPLLRVERGFWKLPEQRLHWTEGEGEAPWL